MESVFRRGGRHVIERGHNSKNLEKLLKKTDEREREVMNPFLLLGFPPYETNRP